MKLTCDVIEDLLPLVAEDLASEDTVKLVDEHIENCKKCRDEYEELRANGVGYEAKKDIELIPLKKIKRKLKKRNIYIGILAALIVSLILFVTFEKLTKPIPIIYPKAIQSIEEDDGKLFIGFSEEVSNYEIRKFEYGGETQYDIVSWRTYLSNILDEGEVKNAVIKIEENNVDAVYYVNQDGNIDKLIYGKSFEENTVTLPRLAMNYYLTIAGIVFIIFMIFSLIYRRNHKINKITIPIMVLSLSYMVSHIIILGTNGVTYNIIRDFFFVSLTGVLLFFISMLLIYKDSFLKIKDK
ncbi:MAG: zf-HC2 domain-containing protein [Senegalia sp. (in: firmicutes)]|uniref:zf-HC2 domain-containing protein n=1 Tax=Senegalia sp. (in: firmicutes) TaxID=1924098 RepID=UPI003F98FF05